MLVITSNSSKRNFRCIQIVLSKCYVSVKDFTSSSTLTQQEFSAEELWWLWHLANGGERKPISTIHKQTAFRKLPPQLVLNCFLIVSTALKGRDAPGGGSWRWTGELELSWLQLRSMTQEFKSQLQKCHLKQKSANFLSKEPLARTDFLKQKPLKSSGGALI